LSLHDMAIIAPRIIPLRSVHATLRSAHGDDAAGTLALLKLASSETDHLVRAPDEMRISEDDERVFLEERRSSPTDLFLVAEVDHTIVGIASLIGTDLRRLSHAAVLGISVARSYWGGGLGRALITALLHWADARGLVRVSLDVLETNTRAIHLYERLGFREEGRLRAHRLHDGRLLDTVVMARVRTPARMMGG
jgi:RimJ/RimL family protein N-acetyltransferase